MMQNPSDRRDRMRSHEIDTANPRLGPFATGMLSDRASLSG
ncbi:hypothetical protein ACQ4M4_23985 [Leptolyngbya sp. AN02str]